jgi:hypothetical protein
VVLPGWGEFGQLIGGGGIVFASLVAWLTYKNISRAQAHKQWTDDFRALSADFWKDDDASLVRIWIISNRQYEDELEPVLKKRSTNEENLMNAQESIKLDKVDKFLAKLVEFQILSARPAANEQRELLKKMPYQYWLEKALSRSELRQYIEKHWGEINTGG